VKTILKLYLRQAFENVYLFSKHISNVNLVEGFFSVLKKSDVNVQVYYNDLFTGGKH
jgi:hypothetical protein